MAKNNQNNLTCPFCGTSFYRSRLSFVSDRLYLKRLKDRLELCSLGKNVATRTKLKQKHPELIRLEMAACPNCHRITVCAVGLGKQYANKKFNLYPQTSAAPLPGYIPAQIRKDYKEAVEIVKISPNSTAMLSRRILEEIIGDFYQVQEGDLYHDLEKLRNDEKNQHIWQAIDAIRRFGNLGVHTVHDVNRVKANRNVGTKEAVQLTKLILVLIHDTYVQRHYRQKIEKKVIKSAKQMDYTPHYYGNEKQFHRNSGLKRYHYGCKKHQKNSHHRYHRWSSKRFNRKKGSQRTYYKKQNHKLNQNHSRKRRTFKRTYKFHRRVNRKNKLNRKRTNQMDHKGFKIVRTSKRTK